MTDSNLNYIVLFGIDYYLKNMMDLWSFACYYWIYPKCENYAPLL